MKKHFSFVALVLLFAAAAIAAQRSASPQQQAAAQAKPSSEQHPAETRPSHDDEKDTVGEIGEDVAKVRFQKLGYRDFGSWTRNGDYLETSATKDGKSWKLRIQVLKGSMEETPVSARR